MFYAVYGVELDLQPGDKFLYTFDNLSQQCSKKRDELKSKISKIMNNSENSLKYLKKQT
jgi:hypothetical protein